MLNLISMHLLLSVLLLYREQPPSKDPSVATENGGKTSGDGEELKDEAKGKPIDQHIEFIGQNGES